MTRKKIQGNCLTANESANKESTDKQKVLHQKKKNTTVRNNSSRSQ